MTKIHLPLRLSIGIVLTISAHMKKTWTLALLALCMTSSKLCWAVDSVGLSDYPGAYYGNAQDVDFVEATSGKSQITPQEKAFLKRSTLSQLGGGFYVRPMVGARNQLSVTGFRTVEKGLTVVRTKLSTKPKFSDTSTNRALAIGYTIDPTTSIELSYELYRKLAFSLPQFTIANQNTTVAGSIRPATVLFNVDMQTAPLDFIPMPVSPFIVLGIGAGRHLVSGLTVSNATLANLEVIESNKQKTFTQKYAGKISLIVQAGVGLKVRMDDNLSFDLAYRYQLMGRVPIASFGDSYKVEATQLKCHGYNASLLYHI